MSVRRFATLVSSFAGVLLLMGLLVACDPWVRSDKANRVFIRSGGTVVSTYELAADGHMSQSTTKDAQGRTVVRGYTYDNTGRLQSVTQGNMTTRRVVSVENGRSVVSRKALVGPDGQRSELTLEYFYKPNGQLDGVIQRDADGNVQAKAADQ